MSARTIGEAVFRVRPDLTGFGAAAERGVAPAMTGTGVRAGESAARGFGSRFGPMMKKLLIAAAGVAIFEGAKRIAEGSVDAFKELAGSVRSAQRVMGGTTSEVSGLRAAFQSSGVDMSKFDTGMTILAKNLGRAQQGGTAAAKMTGLLGDGWQDAHGKALPITELLPKIADQFQRMPDGVQKTYAATQLFGRGGAALLPALNKGSGGITELTKKAKAMGLVLGDDAMEKFMESKKASREWHESLEGLKVTIGSQLLPIGTKLTTWLSSQAAPWMQKFVSQIKSGKGAGGEFASAAQSMGNALMTLAGWLGNVLGWMAAHQGVVKGFASVLLAVAAAIKITSIAMGIFNAVMDANPISLIIIAIAGLAAGLIYLYKHSATARGIMQAVFAGIKLYVEGLITGLKALGQAGKWLWNNALQPAIHFILVGFSKVAGVWATLLAALGKIPGFGWAKKAAEVMRGAAHDAQDLADNIGKIHGKNVKVSVDDKQAHSALNWLDNAIGNFRSKAINLVVNASLHTKQQNVPIPGRAAGGLVYRNMRYLVGEHGPEEFVPGMDGRIRPNNAIRTDQIVANSRSMSSGQAAADGNDAATRILANLAAHGIVVEIGGEQFDGRVRGVADDAIDDRNAFTDFLDRI